jgi:hypothetical protein
MDSDISQQSNCNAREQSTIAPCDAAELSLTATDEPSRIGATISSLWTATKPWLAVAAVAAVVCFFIIYFVRPFEKLPDPLSDDVATAWNESIARLGIIPVYPPAEDVEVGDVWAVVANSEDSPLLGKAIRIDHIDLRKEVLNATSSTVFPDTSDIADGAKFRKQERKELARAAADDRILLTLAAFPGVTITHGVRSGGAAGNASGWFGAQRDEKTVEQIRIKAAETYGVSAVDAVLKLDDWCGAAKTKTFCTDRTLRKLLGYTVSDKLLATKDEKYTSRLQIRLVTRVFLMREIEHMRSANAAGGGAVQILADPSKTPQGQEGAPKTGDSAKTTDNALTATGQGLSPSGSTGARISILRADASEIALKETFQRPLVFGFRAVTISVEPSKPSTGPIP